MRVKFASSMIGAVVIYGSLVGAAEGKSTEPLAVTQHVTTGRASEPSNSPDEVVRSHRGEDLQTLQYGFYTIIGGEPFAVEGETWTFDHGDPDPLEGWTTRDLSAGDAVNAWRRITTTEWDERNGIAAPIPSGDGAAWVGYFDDEALADEWGGGLGYGSFWCQRFQSPQLTYDGTGDVDVSFDYFNNTEDGFDFSRVLVLLGDGTEVLLQEFTGVDGSPPVTFLNFSGTITESDFAGQTDFALVFEMASDGSFDDQDGFYNTAYGPFVADNITLANNIVEGDQMWDFETDDHGFVALQCGQVGDFVGTRDSSLYGDVDCGLLSGNVLELHNDELFHPDGQWAAIFSPAVDISAIQPDSTIAVWDQYSVLPQADGVYFRPSWQYWPSTEGGSDWSDRDPTGTWFFIGSFADCRAQRNVAPEFPAYAERVRFMYELLSDPVSFGLPPCTVEPCNGNETPLLDNLAILLKVPSEAASVAGSIVRDDSGDCVADGTLTKRYALLEPGGSVATSQPDGSFTFGFVEPGSYEVSLIPRTHWEQTCPVSTYDLTVSSGEEVTGIDFATRPILDIDDLTIAVGSQRARPGFKTGMVTEVRNIGTATTEPAEVVLQLPDDTTFDFASDGGVFTPSGAARGGSPGTVTWNVDGLDPEELIRLYVGVEVATTATLGTSLVTVGTVDVVDDVDLSNNTAMSSVVVIGSFDPNDKHVSPVGEIAPEQRLDYHINFQNVGTASAINIVVRDTLDTLLDISTLEIGAASHAYDLEVSGRELIWSFIGIELPDSSSNEPLSHGFVEFSIDPIPDLTPGTEIANRAGIYFDFNEVVLTNEVISTIEMPSNVPEENPVSAIAMMLTSLHPNPTSGVVHFDLWTPEPVDLEVGVFSVDGRLRRSLGAHSVDAGAMSMSWDGRFDAGALAPAGVYFVRVHAKAADGRVTSLQRRIVRIE